MTSQEWTTRALLTTRAIAYLSKNNSESMYAQCPSASETPLSIFKTLAQMGMKAVDDRIIMCRDARDMFQWLGEHTVHILSHQFDIMEKHLAEDKILDEYGRSWLHGYPNCGIVSDFAIA